MPPTRRRATPSWAGRRLITVALLPGRDLYARHLGHPEGLDAVHRAAAGPGTGSGGSAPGPALSRAWLHRNLDDVDLVHVHGLHPAVSPAEVAGCLATIRATGKPLVVTGYHLSDPAGRNGRVHAAQLDELIPNADAVVTLTDSAAAEIQRRWNVTATVLPHPHAVDFVRMHKERPRFHGGQFLVGLHLGGLNLQTDPVRLVDGLTRAAAGLERIRLIILLHRSAVDPGATGYDLATVREIDRLARTRGAGLRVHRPFTESQLWEHLFSLDVSVLPRLHGSHSFWPEACADLGTQALLVAGSHAARQRPCLVYDDNLEVDSLAESLAGSLTLARDQGCIGRADPQARWSERVAVAEAVRAVYERLLLLDQR